jgi:hypothetical protein
MEIDERAAARVIFAVILQAIKDHRRGDRRATQWLQRDALPWLEAAGMLKTPADIRRALLSDVAIIRGSREP